MIKKMRRRMILAAMLAFFAVIMMIAVFVNLVNYGMVTNRADDTLSAILKFEERDPKGPEPGRDAPPKPFMGLPDVESNYMTRFFTVRFDNEGEVTSTSIDYIASVGKDDAVLMAREVLNDTREHGYMKAYRFLKDVKDGETIVVFLNTSREQREMISLLILTLVISFVSLLIVFLLVGLLSKRAIRPFANNIKQQKQFITDASHELKTPLTAISTSLDVISMEGGDSEWTDNIRKQTGRMTRLVSELVALSRLDEETPLPDREHFSISDAAWEIVDVYKPQAKAQDKEMSIDIEDDVAFYGDKAAIQQMFSVLLDNALRYSDEKGEIRFTLNKKKNKINIEVFNTCHYDTIPDVDRLFDRFYRPDESRNSQTGGNGVGLSIARAVTLAHGGRIIASCPSGKTMTIRISI